MSETTFWYTTYNVDGTLTNLTDYDPEKDRKDREFDLFIDYFDEKDPVVEDSSGRWYCGGTDTSHPDYIIGKFGREFIEDASAYNEDKGDFEDYDNDRKNAEYVVLIIHIELELIIHTTRNRVGHEQFKKYFARGFNNFAGGDVTLEIESLENDDEIEQIVSDQPVYGVDVELVPSNPSSDPGWKDLDDRMKEMVAQKLGLDVQGDIENQKDLNVDEDLLNAAIQMVQSPYGEEYTVIYDDNGQIKKITDGDDQVTWTEEKELDSIPKLSAIADSLINFGESFLD